MKHGFTVLLVVLGLAAQPARSQINDLRLPILLAADSTDYDGKSAMLLFEGLQLTQGNIGVQADKGLASKLDFEDSVWQFSGNVIIDTGTGHIECDTADLKFAGHQLEIASITGSPATFELQRSGSDAVTHAEAGRLDYNFAGGVIEFSGDAVITEGGNQISSNYLVYNIKEQRINAQSAGPDDPRVKITYTPRAQDGADGADTDTGEAETNAADVETDEPGEDPE